MLANIPLAAVVGARKRRKPLFVRRIFTQTGLRPESRFGELSSAFAKRIDDGHAAQGSS